MGSIGGGKSESDAKSEQGIRGTSLFEPVTAGMGESWNAGMGLLRERMASPFGFFRGQQVGSSVPTMGPGTSLFGPGGQMTNSGGSVIAPTGKYGASAAIDQGLSGVMTDMFNKKSANAVARGQYSPENTGGIIGSAGAEWAKYAAPIITDWQKYITALPDQLWSTMLGFALEPYRQGSASLGGQSQSSADAWNAGVSVAGDSPSMNKSLGRTP